MRSSPSSTLCPPARPTYHNPRAFLPGCRRNIEMTPLCKVEVTLPGFEGSGRCAVPAVSMSKQEFDPSVVQRRAVMPFVHVTSDAQ